MELCNRIDILVNFAETTDHLRFVTATNDDVYEQTMNNNIRGPFNVYREVLPHMIKQKDAAIVNCASIGDVKGYGGGAAYTMAKSALVGLGRFIAAEYAYECIRCNTTVYPVESTRAWIPLFSIPANQRI